MIPRKDVDFVSLLSPFLALGGAASTAKNTFLFITHPRSYMHKPYVPDGFMPCFPAYAFPIPSHITGETFIQPQFKIALNRVWYLPIFGPLLKMTCMASWRRINRPSLGTK